MTSLRFRKPFRIFAFSLLTIIALMMVTSAILSLFYEKAVIRLMKKYLDEHLLTQLSMDDIRFRVLKGFPNATLEITNAVVLSGNDFAREDFSGSFSDTLLQANSILLQFDLLKLFNHEYELKKIEVSHGQINILFDKQNRHNLKIWKTSAVASQEYSINLRSIVLTATHINLIALPEQLTIHAVSEKTNFKGTYSGNILSGDTRANLALQNLTLKHKKLLQDATVHLALEMMVSGNRIRVSQGRIKLNKATAGFSGEYKAGSDNFIDLTLNMPKFKLEEIISLIPNNVKASMGDLAFSGNGKLNFVINGSLSDRKSLHIRSQFELSNGTARNTNTGTGIDKITLKGTMSGNNAESFALQLQQINAELGKGKITGSLMVSNLNTPYFRSALHADLDLKALKNFAGIDTIEIMEGMIRSDFIAAGNLNRFSADTAATVLYFLESGTFMFEDAGFRFKSLPLLIGHISGKATWGKTIRLDSLALRVNETDLVINGDIQHLTTYLLKRSLLKLNIEVKTDNLDIGKYLKQRREGEVAAGYKSFSIFPPDIYLKAHVEAKKFMAGKFKASELSLNMYSMKDSLYVDHFFLHFPDGSITGNALILRNSNHLFSVTCNAQPQKINIQQTFYCFNNFTQHFIVDKNINGLLSGTVSFFAQWDSTLRFIPKSMKAKGDFEITNGELLQFEPMLKLSKYINVEELKHIRFKTLKNSIFISDRLVTIPEMAINSTAFNISVSGQHSFDNVFDYRLKVLLSEVLFNKARKKKQEINEFLIEENRTDQTTIPLIIAGTPDNFDVHFDRKKAFGLTRSNMKNNEITEEKKPNSGNFKIEWEEPEEKTRENKPVTPNDQSDFEIEWDEDSESN